MVVLTHINLSHCRCWKLEILPDKKKELMISLCLDLSTIPLSCCQTWNYNIFLCSFHRVQIPLGMHIRIEKRFYCLFHLTKIIKHVSFLHKSYENSIVGYKMTKTDLCNWKQIFWHCFLGNIVISWVDITVWSSCNPLKLSFVSNALSIEL